MLSQPTPTPATTVGLRINQINEIIRGEMLFPRRFAAVEERDYGLLFHTPQIPDSHDGNHACILHAKDLAAAVRDVQRLYRTRTLSPRVCHIARRGEDEELRQALLAAGFQVAGGTSKFYRHEQPSHIVPTTELTIERVTSPTPPLMAMIESESSRQMKVVRRSLSSADFHLLVGFLQGQPVTMAAVERVGPIARVDSVLTPAAHRGKGYGRALIHELVQYHARVLGGPLCLYTDNPTAACIYEEAGFAKLDADLEFWSAWKK